MHVQPYLNFDGRGDEAIDYYKTALGAKVNMLMRFKDMPCPPPSDPFPPALLNKVMHASLQIGDSIVLVSDGRGLGKSNFAGMTLSLSVTTDAEALRLFTALAEGGKITMPIAKTFFSSNFGMVTDRFGVPWMVVMQH